MKKIYLTFVFFLCLNCAMVSQKSIVSIHDTITKKKIELEFGSKYFKDSNISLLNHQLLPIYDLVNNKNKKGLLIFHYIGTGKTFIPIAYSQMVPNKKLLVIGPKYLKLNWLDHLKKFGIKDYTFFEYVSYTEALDFFKEKDVSNYIVAIDEAHNLITKLKNKPIKYSDLYFKIQTAHKVFALSATPIFSDETDIAYLLNLVSGQNLLPVNKESFRLQHTSIIPRRAFWRGYVSESLLLQYFPDFAALYFFLSGKAVPLGVGALGAVFPIVNLIFFPLTEYKLRKFDPNTLKKEAIDYISFYPKPSEKDPNFPSSKIHLKEVTYNNEQLRLFYRLAAKELELEDFRLLKIGETFSDRKIKLLSSELITKYRNDITSGREIGNLFLKNEKGENIVPEKFTKLKKLLLKANEKSVIYSNYDELGLQLFEQYLKSTAFKDKYRVLEPSMTIEDQRKVMNDYNTDKIKILLLHHKITEGITLLGTKQLHILEPISNYSILEQVKGRVIRYKSHSHLEPKDRHVDIYIWLAELDDSKALHKGGITNFKTWIGSPYRHEDWTKRHPELNYYSQWGQGRDQVDLNFEYKRHSPDYNAYMRALEIKESIQNLNSMLGSFSIEQKYKKGDFHAKSD